jgi:hypothetical protein
MARTDIKRRDERQASATIPAASTVTLVSIKISNNEGFALTHFANYVGATLAWGNLTWKVLVNGIPQAPIDNQKDQRGDQITPQQVYEEIICGPCDLLEIICTNSDAVNGYVAGVLMKGDYFKT